MYTCWVCNQKFDTYETIRKHIGRKHKIHSSEVYVRFNLNGVWPLCSCGCEEKLEWTNVGFRKYIWGHQARVKNNWGHNESAKIKSKKTQKKMYESGELVVWNKGLTVDDPRVKTYVNKINTPERAKKISESMAGKKKQKHVMEALANGSRNYWKKRENRKKQSRSRCDYISNFGFPNKSNTKPERIFKSILKDLGVNFEQQFVVTDGTITKIYDFYIPSKNILVEVDGDYYHCNPLVYKNGPINEIQKSNIENDIVKNNLASDMGYHIIRFWEHDILKSKSWVVDLMKMTLS